MEQSISTQFIGKEGFLKEITDVLLVLQTEHNFFPERFYDKLNEIYKNRHRLLKRMHDCFNSVITPSISIYK